MEKDRVLSYLFYGLVFYAGLAGLVAWLFPANEKLMALIAGIVGNFSGAFLMYVRPKQ